MRIRGIGICCTWWWDNNHQGVVNFIRLANTTPRKVAPNCLDFKDAVVAAAFTAGLESSKMSFVDAPVLAASSE
jgi:hypothetical protein